MEANTRSWVVGKKDVTKDIVGPIDGNGNMDCRFN